VAGPCVQVGQQREQPLHHLGGGAGVIQGVTQGDQQGRAGCVVKSWQSERAKGTGGVTISINIHKMSPHSVCWQWDKKGAMLMHVLLTGAVQSLPTWSTQSSRYSGRRYTTGGLPLLPAAAAAVAAARGDAGRSKPCVAGSGVSRSSSARPAR
jgi:hypothetical protein